MSIADYITLERTTLAVLIDPEKQDLSTLSVLIEVIADGHADLILVGGSTRAQLDMQGLIARLKETCSQPVILFPGHVNQLSADVDMILLPSIISGDSFKYLIGSHIHHAEQIKALNVPVSSAGYILIDGGSTSSTSKMTESTPISSTNVRQIKNTAIAAQMIGMSSVYIEAGSGAVNQINTELIATVAQSIDIPLIVGGGIKSVDRLETVLKAMPDMVVIGNALEKSPLLLPKFYKVLTDHNRLISTQKERSIQ